MARYIFRIEIAGVGSTEEEAYTNAIEAFYDDPGEPRYVDISDDPEEED